MMSLLPQSERVRAAAVTFATLVALTLPGAGVGCGYDVQIGGGITTAHAASIPVALAVHDAVSVGRLAPIVDVPAPLALVRAIGTMRNFAFLLRPRAA